MAFYVPGISWGGRAQNGRKNINAQSGSQDTSTPDAPARLHRRLMIVAAIDIGGTFTDLVAFEERSGRFVQAKSLTTPAQLVQGIIDCVRKSGLESSDIAELIHGSTIALHTPIQRKGGRAGCEKFAAEGVQAVAICFLHSYVNPRHEPEAGEIVRKLMPGAYLSLSHQILREYREFERMSTTVVNAYIGPKVGGYVRGLKASLADIGFEGELTMMRSSGGVLTPA